MGKLLNSKFSKFKLLILLEILSFTIPGKHIPAKSPFMSTKNTGTPAEEKLSAKTFREIVFPLPLAPLIIPCLLAILESI